MVKGATCYSGFITSGIESTCLVASIFQYVKRYEININWDERPVNTGKLLIVLFLTQSFPFPTDRDSLFADNYWKGIHRK